MPKVSHAPAVLLAAIAWPLLAWAADGPDNKQSSPAYILDTTGLLDVGELYLIGALQGIVNRDAPRLFQIKGTPDSVYVDYLEKKKGFTFTRLKSLPDAIATFKTMKRADGMTPLIKGLIKYPPTYWDEPHKKMVNRYYNYWIAANIAAQEDLLPVNEWVIQHKTPMLSGSEFWHKDTGMGGWGDMFVTMRHSGTKGMSVTSGRDGAYARKVVYLDLDVTPKIEIVVSDLSPGGAWSLIIALGSTIKTFENNGGVRVPGLTKEGNVGTFVVDLAKSGLFSSRSGRAELRIAPSAPKVVVTVKSIRLLDANGQEPPAAPYSPRKNSFEDLPTKWDLVAEPPYKQDEESACEWSLANQRKQCAPDAFASYAGGDWVLCGLDYTIAQKIYHFYQDKTAFVDGGYPNLDRILGDLKPPGRVFGWLGNEDYSCMKLGQYGARYAGGMQQNFSFWQWVPLTAPGKPVLPPQSREVDHLENKVYVNFSWASSDMVQFNYSLMDGYWQDPNRGKVPVTWGFNPLLAKSAPAFVEFFAQSATPKDSFWGFTAGYTHLSGFPSASLREYAEETSFGIKALGLSPAVDVWDCFTSCKEVYEQLSLRTPTSEGVKLMSILPGGGRSETYWLDNGCPVVRLDNGLFSVWGYDGKSTPETIAASIRAAVAKHPEKGPQFLTCNCRFSPTFLKSVKELLPSNMVIVGMPDFIALAQEAGAVAALPFSDSVGSGDTLKVSFELHNASGLTGNSGKVTWTLPTGWKSSPGEWVHDAIPLGGVVKTVVTLIPPAGMTSGTATIGYKDSRFDWDKELILSTHPQSVSVSDCEDLNGWKVQDGAAICLERGMIKITPKVVQGRHDAHSGKKLENNGRVTFMMKQIDFGRKPILKITTPDFDSSDTRVGVTDDKGQFKECTGFTTDLGAVTHWTGIKDLTLSVDPATRHGKYIRIRSIKVCYQK